MCMSTSEERNCCFFRISIYYIVSVLEVLLFVALWFILRGDLLYVLPCAILFLCFSILLELRLPRLGKRELILVLFVCLIDLLVWICRFPLPLDVWEGLRFVIVASPGLFSYLSYIVVYFGIKFNHYIATNK